MPRPTIWLFNTKEHNWDECTAGPPDIDIHGGHISQPWHGLSQSSAGFADDMRRGEIAIVRQSGSGVMGVWEIVDTAPVQSQDHHNWREDYARFVYCRALDREFGPFDDTQYFDRHDYARFNRAANKLNDEDARTFISNLLDDMGGNLSSEAWQQLHFELAALDQPQPTDGTTRSSDRTGNESSPKRGQESTSGTVRERTGTEVTIRESFRKEVLSKYGYQCLLTDVQGPPFVTVAHIVPRADNKDEAENHGNVTVLNWLHHQAFDAKLFTFDSEMRLRVDPHFETQSEFLRETLLDREGEVIELPLEASIGPQFLQRRNEEIDWF